LPLVEKLMFTAWLVTSVPEPLAVTLISPRWTTTVLVNDPAWESDFAWAVLPKKYQAAPPPTASTIRIVTTTRIAIPLRFDLAEIADVLVEIIYASSKRHSFQLYS
jgi:hypothetical protein